MSKLSAVIIVKNEEPKIGKCLDSLARFTDQIVVVDDLSIDRTVAICNKYGAKVISHASGGNFDNQRNIGIENSSGEWILQMDADEVIPENTAEAIRGALDEPGEFVAFKVIRKNFFMGYPLKYTGGRDYMVKLFKKGKAVYVGGSVHETLKIDGPVGTIEADVHHYPFDSIRQFIERCNFYTDVESEAFLKSKEKVSFKEIQYRLTWKSLKLFWKLYFKKKGYKDGMYGLVWCVLNVIASQVRWLKIWERALKTGKIKDNRWKS